MVLVRAAYLRVFPLGTPSRPENLSRKQSDEPPFTAPLPARALVERRVGRASFQQRRDDRARVLRVSRPKRVEVHEDIIDAIVDEVAK